MKSYDERFAEASSYYQESLKRVKNTPPPKGQKFAPGTLVMIAKDLDPSMSHFKSNTFAIVEYTYAHAFGGTDIKNYSLLVRFDKSNWRSISWYYEWQLTEEKDQDQFKDEQRNET